MKNLGQHSVLGVVLICLTIQACKDEENASRSVVEFQSSAQNVREGGDTTIVLTLEPAASIDGSVKLRMVGNANYGQDYATDPGIESGVLTVPFAKGDQSVSFKVEALDDNRFEGAKAVTFAISDPGGSLQLGATRVLTLSIIDDEGPSLANFESESGTVNEGDDEGIVIKVLLSTPTKGTGAIAISIVSGSERYGTRFSTVPDMTFYTSVVEVEAGVNESSASFRVLPLNNTLFTGDLVIKFSISYASGVIQKGNLLTYSLTIKDDEKPSIVGFKAATSTIAESGVDMADVEILFSPAVVGDGKVIIEVPGYDHSFTAQPEIRDWNPSIGVPFGSSYIPMEVSSGVSSVKFSIKATNNDRCSGSDRQATFRIAAVEGALGKGVELTHVLTIKEDDETAFITFSESEGSINESDASGKLVTLSLSNPSAAFGQIFIFPGNYTKGRYATVPGMLYDYSSGYYTIISVDRSDTNYSFMILPVNDQVVNGNLTETFTILAPGNCLVFASGASRAEYKLAIVDND